MKLGQVLKIKDNIDLKILEKYGFKQEELFGQEFYNYYISEKVILSVIVRNREIYIDIEDKGIFEVDIPTVLYDMIQNGLIEKGEI